MTGQLSPQQLAAFIASHERRRDSTKLAIDSLNTIREQAPVIVQLFFQEQPGEPLRSPAFVERNAIADAAVNYLTARINWLLIDLQERELQIKALKYQQTGILIAHPSNNKLQG